MERFGRTTGVFESFNNDLESSFLLAIVLGDACMPGQMKLSLL